MKYPIADQEKFAFLKDKTILFDMQKLPNWLIGNI